MNYIRLGGPWPSPFYLPCSRKSGRGSSFGLQLGCPSSSAQWWLCSQGRESLTTACIGEVGGFLCGPHVVIEKDVPSGRKVCYSYPGVCAHLDGVIVVPLWSLYARLYWEDSTYVSIHQNIYPSLYRHFQPHIKPSLCFHRVPSTETLILIQQMAKDQAVLRLGNALQRRSMQEHPVGDPVSGALGWRCLAGVLHHKCLHGTFPCRGSTAGSCSLPGLPGGWDIRHLHLIASVSLGSQCSEDEAIRKQCTILGWKGYPYLEGHT